MDYKKKVLEQLKLLADDKRAKKETFRVRAYQNAIQAIKEYEGEINTPEDIDKISGLAKGSIRKKIIELIKTGEISQVKDITTNIKIIQDLSNIYGVGPSKANELISKYKISSVEDLREKYEKDNFFSNNKTLKANVSLIINNADLAGKIAKNFYS